MRAVFKLALLAALAAYPLRALQAQDLAPRAYIITPVHWNAITLSYSFSDGGLSINNAIPVTGATGIFHVPTLPLAPLLWPLG